MEESTFIDRYAMSISISSYMYLTTLVRGTYCQRADLPVGPGPSCQRADLPVGQAHAFLDPDSNLGFPRWGFFRVNPYYYYYRLLFVNSDFVRMGGGGGVIGELWDGEGGAG